MNLKEKIEEKLKIEGFIVFSSELPIKIKGFTLDKFHNLNEQEYNSYNISYSYDENPKFKIQLSLTFCYEFLSLNYYNIDEDQYDKNEGMGARIPLENFIPEFEKFIESLNL